MQKFRVRLLPFLVLAFALTSCDCGEPMPGDHRAFDPVAQLPAVIGMIGAEYEFYDMNAQGVASNGLIDFERKEAGGEVRYRLVAPRNPPANQPPLGAGGSLEQVFHQFAHVKVRRPGYHHLGQIRDSDGQLANRYEYSRGVTHHTVEARPGPPEARPMPTCSPADLWSKAMSYGAPAHAVATITFDGRSYSFSISGTDHRYSFNDSCECTSGDCPEAQASREEAQAAQAERVKERTREQNKKSVERLERAMHFCHRNNPNSKGQAKFRITINEDGRARAEALTNRHGGRVESCIVDTIEQLPFRPLDEVHEFEYAIELGNED